MGKLRVGVIFGGRSGEHAVSLRSAQTVMAALSPDRYEVIPIGISPSGEWLTEGPARELLGDGASHPPPALPPSPLSSGSGVGEMGTPATGSGLALWEGRSPGGRKLDVVIPVLHGTFGEDGTIQGLLELADVPYVGAGVLGSAVSMDKITMKQVLRAAGLPVGPYRAFGARDWRENREGVVAEVLAVLGFPVFVKPANLGSSVGISRVSASADLEAALDLAFGYDRRVVVERSLAPCREVECAVLGNDDPQVSVVGEIRVARDFYDYAAKYSDDQGTELIIPADLSSDTAERVRSLAKVAFLALDCAGLARADFFVGVDGGEPVLINELNTIPGFTAASMYPRLWAASGVPIPALVDRLIELALERHAEKSQLRRSFL